MLNFCSSLFLERVARTNVPFFFISRRSNQGRVAMVALLGHSQRKTERQYVGAMKPRNRREMLVYGREGGTAVIAASLGPSRPRWAPRGRSSLKPEALAGLQQMAHDWRAASKGRSAAAQEMPGAGKIGPPARAVANVPARSLRAVRRRPTTRICREVRRLRRAAYATGQSSGDASFPRVCCFPGRPATIGPSAPGSD